MTLVLAGIVKLTLFLSSRLMWHTRRMSSPPPTNLYKRHRFPAEIISHGVWLYFRLCLSYRDVRGTMYAPGAEQNPLLRKHM
jgi:hypothetical protein